jgi:hypothetical protein
MCFAASADVYSFAVAQEDHRRHCRHPLDQRRDQLVFGSRGRCLGQQGRGAKAQGQQRGAQELE